MNPMKDAHTKFEFARPEAIRAKKDFQKKKKRHREGDTRQQIHLQLQHFEFFLVFLFISVKIPGKKGTF